MCSIPGLPTPGTEASVLITATNLNPRHGFVELWVKMDDERKHIYEQMTEGIQSPQRKFNESEGKPGDLCLVSINNTWHRARIVGIHSEGLEMFLVDQAKAHKATRQDLAWGESDVFLLPPEVESCVLMNVVSMKECPERITRFLTCLPGKNFKGLVQHVLMPNRIILLDIPILSKHMCKLGAAKKMKAEEFRQFVQKCFQGVRENSKEVSPTPEQRSDICPLLSNHNHYCKPELSTDTYETVVVTEVTNQLVIFCKLHIFSNTLQLLSEEINQHYERSPPSEEVQPQICGDPCAARGADGRWRRALLKEDIERSDSTVEVFYVDEGSIESVHVRDIRPLLETFLRMPVVTYSCRLNGLNVDTAGWTKDEIELWKSILLDQTLVGKFNSYNKIQDVYYITLFNANQSCINQMFLKNADYAPCHTPELDIGVQNDSVSSSPNGKLLTSDADDTSPNKPIKNQAVNGTPSSVTNGKELLNMSGFQSNSNCFFTSLQNFCEDKTFAAGDSVDVNVSCIDSLERFWCQTVESLETHKLLMGNLQKHCHSSQPEPLINSIGVARYPDTANWYRAKILRLHESLLADVRFIDHGQTCSVPLVDVCSIDPTFTRLKPQAFQCCLHNVKKSAAADWNEIALAEFRNFVEQSLSTRTGLKCVIKAVTYDDKEQSLLMVDIENKSESVCKLINQKCSHGEVQGLISTPVQANRFSHSCNIEVGSREKILVTSVETIGHFYCQLVNSYHALKKIEREIAKLPKKPSVSDLPIELDGICLARYTDDQWCRGQVVETSPKLKVKFVDVGDIRCLREIDTCPIPSESSFVVSTPVQAVPLGLCDVPVQTSQEVNQWFANHVLGRYFTIAVLGKGEGGKMMVEMFDGIVSVNSLVVEKLNEQQQTNSSPSKGIESKDTNNNSGDINSTSSVCVPEFRNLKTPSQAGDKALDGNLNNDSLEEKQSTAKCFIQPSCNVETNQRTHLCSPAESLTGYRWAKTPFNVTLDVYASSIVGPHYFWCQLTKTEEIDMVSKLSQEAARDGDVNCSSTLDPGGPCLALFSSDNQWYRGQVIQKSGDTFSVLFVDYGNESEVAASAVRPIPQSLLEIAPQGILCSLNGFSESEGCWTEEAYDDFYNMLTDKPAKITVIDSDGCSENAVPNHKVILESDNLIINAVMLKYWKSLPARESPNTEEYPASQSCSDRTDEDETCFNEDNVNSSTYRDQDISKDETHLVYASCIVDPHFFWCQFANEEDLQTVSQLAQETGLTEQDHRFSQSLRPGSPCLAMFPSDGQWYRAQVIQRVDDAIQVVFVDFGNESDVDVKDVRPLSQSLMEKVPLAFLCRLHGFDTTKGSWDDGVHDDFYNSLADKLLKLQVCNLGNHPETSQPQYSVEIESDGVNLNTIFQKYWKPIPTEKVASDKTDTEDRGDSSLGKVEPTRPISKTEIVYASCIVEPHFFWCQFANADDLQKVTQLAQEAGQTQQDEKFSQTLGPGNPCLAVYSCDSQWYRAQVTRKEDNTLRVVFVDYGNESEVDVKDVRPLTQDLLKIPSQAFFCSLDGFDKTLGSWDDEVYDDFYNLVIDKPLRVSVVNVEEHPEIAVPQYSVKVECEGKNANNLMKKHWKSAERNVALAATKTMGDMDV